MIDKIILRKDLYARTKTGVNQDIVINYSEHLGDLPPVEISQDKIMIDGWHRVKAYELSNRQYIPFTITNVENEREIYMLSVKRNSRHGLNVIEGNFKTEST